MRPRVEGALSLLLGLACTFAVTSAWRRRRIPSAMPTSASSTYVSKLPEAQGLILKDPNNPQDVLKVFMYLVSLTSKPPIKAFMTPEVAGTVWKENVKIADENNKPGTFTAFCSYEYTSQFNNRNIFFRDCAKVSEMPFSMLDSWHPEDLWKWMDAQRKAGNELLAISHNANLSDGWMYPTDVDSFGRPIDARLGGRARPNRAARRDQADQGPVGDPSAAVTQRRARQLRDPRIPPIQSTVDFDKATYSNTVGSTELKATWTDPEFDPSLHAFYYARALEIPTPRWSLIQAREIGVAPPDSVPATVQERAWSSPIWYTPSAEARKSEPPGLTVAALTKKGATVLGDTQLKALIVGKAHWLRNNVTGDAHFVQYDETGNALVHNVGRRQLLPGAVGNTPLAMAVYKLGDTYYGARSNELGYANYEMLAKGPANLVKLGKGEYEEQSQDAFLRTQDQ